MLGEFEYVRAKTIKGGYSLLAKAGGEAAVLAGGTDLLVNIRAGKASPRLLVDMKGVKSLDRLTFSPKTGALIGASVPLNTIVENRGIRTRYPGLAEAAWTVGSYQIRNRATIAGNLCNASPAADTAPPLLVLDAILEVASPRGEREVPVRSLFVDSKKTSLSFDEVVTAIRIPPVPATTRTAFLKRQRVKGHDLAILNVAGRYDPATGDLQIAIGSCAKTPVLVPPLGEPVPPDAPIPELARRLEALAIQVVHPISDLRATAEYRRALLPVFIRRLLEALLQQSDHREAIR
ncbi:MAG: xanthine dehydrogenase family protein subunit M [Candidatus Bipolaricaulota bacterium]|nr:xanthine dehydrogenase family protein subunit M [Candidatus Bipolaricaulota bacterium]